MWLFPDAKVLLDHKGQLNRPSKHLEFYIYVCFDATSLVTVGSPFDNIK